jgi:uridylate kinase
MNALVFSAFLEKKGVKTAVFSSRSMPSFCDEFSFDRAEKAFSEGRVCFFCGGTGNPYFTTDSASALKAIETKCDVYAKATTVDGVYDSDPRKNPDAKKYSEISFDEVISKDLKVMDTSAFALCRENSLPIIVFDGAKKGNIAKVIAGENIEKIGTLVS